MPEKNPGFDLKLQYKRVFEISIILALLIIIGAFRYFPEIKNSTKSYEESQELINMLDVPNVNPPDVPPPPPKPVIPIEAPDDDNLPDIEVINTDLIENADIPEISENNAEEENFDDIIFIGAEEMPEPIGGIEGIQKKIVYPEIAKRAGVQGRVTVRVVVNKKGEIEKAELLKGIGAGCDEAAIAAIMKTKFKPGKQRDKPVKVQISIPIYFKLN